MIILVSGTPGTGKTTIGAKLAYIMGIPCYNAHDEAIRLGMVGSKDAMRDADIIDEDDIERMVDDIASMNKSFILEGLLSHYAMPAPDRICVVVTCDIAILNLRLRERDYSERKIKENVDSEIFRVIENEAVERGHDIILFDNSGGIEGLDESIRGLAMRIHDSISSN
jgi:adenylate kinase